MNDIDYPKFNPLQVTRKIAICGLPLRLDTYRMCSFNCKYCFARNSSLIRNTDTFKIADIKKLGNRLERIFVQKKIFPNNFTDYLINKRITWHCGGMSDPYQQMEKYLGITSKSLEVTNRYNISILFSTKSDDVYDWSNLRPNLHSFQLSITSVEDHKDLEPNVAGIERRKMFFDELKRRGFKVGIRIQPFLPGISDERIVDMFKEADFFTIEGLKLISNDKVQKKFLLQKIGLNETDFFNMGLLNMKKDIKLRLYAPVIRRLEEYKIPYSIADNDLHYMTKSKCCCGDPLIKKSTDFNDTAVFFKRGEYDRKYVLKKIKGCEDCNIGFLFKKEKSNYYMTVKEYFTKKKKLFSE